MTALLIPRALIAVGTDALLVLKAQPLRLSVRTPGRRNNLSGVCVEKILHSCGHIALQTFQADDGTYNGYCFSCGKYEADPYNDKPAGYKPVVIRKTVEQIKQEIADVTNYPVSSLPDRKLRDSSLAYFGVKIGVSEVDGVSPVSAHFPYYRDGALSGYKSRLLERKQMWSIGDCKEVDLFGWEQAVKAGGKKLFITEGEFDAVALYQVLKDGQKGTQWEHLDPPVVSVPHGAAAAAKDLSKLLRKIKGTFKEIVLVFDKDDAGEAAVTEIMQIIPSALAATLPCKDANECLIRGFSKALKEAVVFRSEKPKNSRIVSGSSLHEASKEAAQYGASWPWEHITKATRGIRFGETIYIGAGQKQGKSEVVNTLAAHFIQQHGWKVFLCKPEESNKKTYKLVAGKVVGKVFHDPEIKFDEKAYDEAGKILDEKLFMLDLYQHVDFSTLKGDIKQAALDGCKAVMIDPITNFTNGMDAASANTKLQEIAQELAAMALDLDIVVFVFCHLRNPDQGPPHERGGEVMSHQFAGSRAMARSCNLMIGLEGNRDPNLPIEEKNVRHLVLLEDRENGETGRFGLYWDKETGLFNEMRM
jgi:twinkle protein